MSICRRAVGNLQQYFNLAQCQLNNPVTFLGGAASHIKTLGSNIGKVFTASSDAERAKAAAAVLLPSLSSAEATAARLKKAANGDMMDLGSLAADGAVLIAQLKVSGSKVQASKVVEEIETSTPPPSPTTTSLNRGKGAALEKANNSKAQAYENSAEGAASDVASRKRIVPTLKFDNPNPIGNMYVKLDGFEEGTSTFIDRKLNVTGFPKSVDQVTRAAEALSQNPGFSLRYEVPANRLNATIKLIRDAGQQNNSQISVSVVNP